MSRPSNPERQVQALGIFVHGVLAGLHLLGFVYNLKRKNWLDVSMHGLATGYDAYAVVKHINQVAACDETDYPRVVERQTQRS